MPKSYLSESEKVGLDHDTLYLTESEAATDAGDMEASWDWLAMTNVSAETLSFLKTQYGADWIRERGFNTTAAEKAYGKDWLNKN